MKKKKNFLEFNKMNVVELNSKLLVKIVGGVNTGNNDTVDATTGDTTQTGLTEESGALCNAITRTKTK